MSILVLGNAPGELELGYVLGESWTDGLIFEYDGSAAPWPSAPVLKFVAASLDEVVATLSQNGSRADWTLTQQQVAALDAAEDRHLKLRVGGTTWLSGIAVKYA